MEAPVIITEIYKSLRCGWAATCISGFYDRFDDRSAKISRDISTRYKGATSRR